MSQTYKTPKGTILPILDMRGKPYLQVAHRLVWFREECPKHSIETEFVQLPEGAALARAVIKDEQGRVLSIAHKYEDKRGFEDYREKAETGAIGRALAMIGFGTQFCADELDEGNRLADSPIVRPLGAVRPEQPELKDGHDHASVPPYRIPFGKYQKRGLEEISLTDLRSYIQYIEKKAEKDRQPITGQVLDFIERASAHIAAMENFEPGSRE